MPKESIATSRFLVDNASRPISLSFYPRQLVLMGCVAIAGATLLFSSGVVVGRWYGASIVEKTPTLSSLDAQVQEDSPASMPRLSFHDSLPKPLPAIEYPAEEEEKEEAPPAKPTKPSEKIPEEAPEDQDPPKPKKPSAVEAEAKKPEVKKAEPSKPEAKKPSQATAEAKKTPEPKKEEAKKEEPKKETKPAVAKTEPKKKESFTLQVGIFSSKKEAEALVKRLKDKGEKPVLVSSSETGTHTVRVGSYTSLEDAKQAQKGLKAKSFTTMVATK